jgi:hypothetical protein
MRKNNVNEKKEGGDLLFNMKIKKSLENSL